ncbi:MAG: DUF3268 family zinc-finger domain-containing protein [Prevotella sp.]|nr:DUF3268 family zinc-finger domain-containing protein [Bacteroides sp.]MCM1365971.1 DUF3268 family zinc-finger domain-containing protein [Prevotella sp.]MCM1436608.1 DUF3268 family zinc-finger domain-containing protein [Prevotella sp.]
MDKKIKDGEVCQYCMCDTIVQHRGMVRYRVCPKCGASVRCHDGTERGMGSVADRATGRSRKEAHRWFDAIWKNKLKKSRYNAYSWLALRLKMNKDDVHFGLFDEHKCNEVIKLCKAYIFKHDISLYNSLMEES